MGILPRILRGAHHGVENLVVIAATAQIPGKRVRELRAGWVLVVLQETDRAHDEAGHAKGALESLFVHHRPLHRVQISVGAREAFDRQDFAPTQCVGEH